MMGLRTGVLAGEEWFSIYVVRRVIKDVSHESAMSVIPISCRRSIVCSGWLYPKKRINLVTQVLNHACCQVLTMDHWKFYKRCMFNTTQDLRRRWTSISICANMCLRMCVHCTYVHCKYVVQCTFIYSMHVMYIFVRVWMYVYLCVIVIVIINIYLYT